MVSFFKDVLHLTPDIEEEGFAVFRLASGDTVEVFAADDEYHQHFTTGPVVGFRVDDVPAAQAEMEAAGIEFFGRPESAVRRLLLVALPRAGRKRLRDHERACKRVEILRAVRGSLADYFFVTRTR